MVRITKPFLLLLAVPILVSPGRAQIRTPLYATKTDPEEIEKAYRLVEPFKSMKFRRYDRLPFVFFVEDQGRGDLEHLVNLRLHALNSIVALFEKDFAGPLKLKRRERPLPFWILKDRASYTRVGGSKFSAAFFHMVALHTMTYYTPTESAYKAFGTAMHEAVHQIMYAYTDPKVPFHLNAMSAWLMEGMAEHLSSRPKEPFLLNKDPGFGALDLEKIAEVRPYARKPFSWKRKSRLPWIHHPMYVMTYDSLNAYMQATGSDPSRAEDYSQQMGFFYSCAHAIVAFLDRAYSGALRPKLLRILALEYNTENRLKALHGSRAINEAFTDSEKAALPGLFARFVRDPRGTIAAKLPEDWSKGAVLVEEAGARLFPEKKVEGPELPKPPSKKDLSKVPDRILLARALMALRNLDLESAREMVEAVDLGVGDDVDDAADGIEDVMGELAKALEGRRKVKIFLPEYGRRTRYLAWILKAWRPSERTFQVERKGKTKVLGFGEVPPHFLGETLDRLKLLSTKERRLGIRVLVGLHLRGLEGTRRKAAEKRAAKRGLLPPEELFREAGPALDLLDLFLAARMDLLGSADGEKVLAGLARDLDGKSSPELRWIVRSRLPLLLRKAFDSSRNRLPGLAGKVTYLPRGRVRIEYDWKSDSQARDWIPVDPAKDGFTTTFGALGTKAHDILRVDRKEGRALFMEKGYLRHKLQFEGDLQVSFKVLVTSEISDEGEQYNSIRIPPPILLHALRPQTYTLWSWGGMLGFVDGRRRVSRKIRKKAMETMLGVLQDDGEFTIARKGAEVVFSGDGEEIARMKASKLPSRGALILVQPFESREENEPATAIGPLVVEGKPHPKSLSRAWAGFLHRWLPRFPALLEK